MKLFIKMLSLLVIFFSCQEKSTNIEKISPSKVNTGHLQKEGESFAKQYEKFCLKGMEDTKIIDFITTNFDDHSPKNNEFYSYLFCYLLHVTDEDASEGIGANMFDFYENNSERLKSFTDRVNEFDEDTKNRLIDRFIELLCLDMYADDYTIDDFRKSFEGLLIYKTSINTFKHCQESW